MKLSSSVLLIVTAIAPLARSLSGMTMQANKVSTMNALVDSFQSRPFIPKGGSASLRANCHWQTIIGSEVLTVKFLGKAYPRNFETSTERVITPDGDFFDMELTSCLEKNELGGIVVILHGLESNTKGPLVTKMCRAYLARGFSCALVGFRGCNGEDNNTVGAYHLGFTKDLDLVTRLLHTRYPERPIYLSGFSLGGNVCLKFLGEIGDGAAERGIAGASVTCVPFDPIASQGKLDVGFNKMVYSSNFLQTLKKKAERQIARFPGAFDIDRVRQCSTIGEFDDEFIANIYNFAGKNDYYRQSGAKWWLHCIRTPTLALNARDDPFIEESSLPTRQDVGEEAPVRLVYTDHGGHCGFLADKLEEAERDCGYLSFELARFLSHIHEAGRLAN